ncbi:hypothetical protein HK100_001186 [Physocladia obscura]|uniref:J domain-containing protein n=1 Tax=Physocladia obscura TaxID=109957 RepID=A0AAD5SXC8_9FUNG|nr:hypothetical protein HK100_001186 [Physocladia obscura]
MAEVEIERIQKLLKRNTNANLYQIINLTAAPPPSDADIKKAYRKVCFVSIIGIITLIARKRKLALLLHPDKCNANGCVDAFKAVSHAHSVLSDPDKRKQYDVSGVDPDSALGKARNAPTGGTGPAFGADGFAETINPHVLFELFFPDDVSKIKNNFDDQSLKPGAFSWYFGDGYSQEKNTTLNHVGYFVNAVMFEKIAGNTRAVRNFERVIETQYYRTLNYRCLQEQEQKSLLFSNAKASFLSTTVENSKMEALSTFKMVSCENLTRWRKQ